MGYLDNDKETWDAFNSEGYFHTGDRGYVNRDGHVVLKGRVKEVMVTSSG